MDSCDLCHQDLFVAGQKKRDYEDIHVKCYNERERRRENGLCIWCGDEGKKDGEIIIYRGNHCDNCNKHWRGYEKI